MEAEEEEKVGREGGRERKWSTVKAKERREGGREGRQV